MSRRRGDSDDEGAAPPVNHRGGMGGSIASQLDSSVASMESPRSSFTPRSVGPTWMSPPNQQQQSASTHSAGAHLQQRQSQMQSQSQMQMVNSHSTHGYNHNESSSIDRRNSTNSNGYHHNYHGSSGSSKNGNSSNNKILRASTSSSSDRYLTRSTKLPSRWVLDPQDRALMSATSLDRTNLRLNHGPAGDTSHVTALPPSSASHTSTEAKGRCVVIVSNHSIPLDHLKEVALKNGMNHGLHQNGGAGDYGSLLSDGPLSEASGGSTIDQILSNLRTKTTFTTSPSSSGIHGRTINRRATSASLYPSLPGERGGSSMAAGGTGGTSSGNYSLSTSSHDDRRFRSSTGNSTGVGMGVTASAGALSPHAGGTTPRKTTSSPVYYFEVLIQALPADATVSIGMVVTDGPAANTDDPVNKPVIPGYIKQSIGLTSKGELKVSGRSVEEKKFALDGGDFQVGDVIGCGLEVVGTRRVFFTRNGKTVIPPTRFQDVEPKSFAYSPSVGIATSSSATNDASTNNGGVSVHANFGGKSGRPFQWEEADVSHIVNSSSVGQQDQKQPPGGGYDGNGRSSGRSGDAAKGQSSSHSLSPLRQTEYLEQRSAPPSQLYNFGKPSSQGELMSSLDNLPLANDDCDNDADGCTGKHPASMPTNGGVHEPENKASAIDLSVTVSASKGALAASAAPAVKSLPSHGTQQSTVDVKVTQSAPARKSSGRSKSPRGLFSFGKSSKRSSQGASTPDRNSSLGSTSSQKKTSSRSASPAFFGLKSKKKGGDDLLDEDEDENDIAQTESDFQKMATAAVQEMPSSSRQAPVDRAITGVSQTAVGTPSKTPPPPSSNSLFGKKSKKNSLDDDNPSDIQLQSQVSNTVTPPKTQAQASGGVGGTTYLAAQSSGTGTQTLFGKKSKKSSLDDDNPADVQLQTTISNDFPLDIARMPSGPNGTASGIVPSVSGVQNGPGSSTLMMFGKKSRRGTLEDDDVDDHAQTNFANLPSDYGQASGVASLPGSDAQGSAVVFGYKSKKSSLEDDDPDDNQYQTHAQLTFGSKSKKKSLEDDDPDDDKYESHSSLTGTGVHLDAPTKNGSLEDVTDRKHAAHASLTPAIGGSTGIALGIPDGSRYSAVSLPVSNPMAGIKHNLKPASTPHAYGSDGAKNSQQEDGAYDGLPGSRSSFGLPSKKGSLEDDDPNDSSYQSHSRMPGSEKKQNSLENDDPNVTKYQNSAQKHEWAAGPLNVNPFAPRGSMTPGNPARGSPERHRQNMMRSAPIGASTGNASMPVSFDSPISSSIPGRANLDNLDISQIPSVPQSSNRESAASLSSAHAPEGASEDDMLKAAIEASKNDQKKEELQCQAGDTGGFLRDPKEIEAIRDNTRTLRMSAADEGVDASVLQSLLEICRADQAKIQACLQSEDPPVDFMEMLALNELVVDDIKMGQKMIEGMKKKAPASTAAAAAVTSSKSSKTNLNLDIGALVEKKDIFSLICILRAQSDQRLDAALALMNFAREADSLAEAGGRSLRDEIRSSGGMHSLITVFRSKGASYELRVVSALAVAYVLPSFVESSSVHPSVGLKIMECLRFLSTSRLVSPNGRRISQEEMYRASAAGVTTFWINELTPMLNSGAGAPKNDSTAERSDLFSRTNKKGRRRGRTGGQRHQTLELQELLEMTVSLIVQIERLGENEAFKKNQTAQTDSLFLWRYTNVEQVCAVDVARPIAVREGLLPILVGWIRSKDREKVRPAVSALRYLTSIKDKYMAGWIHSQMVNEGALSEVVKLADDYYVGQDVRLAVAQILASLCVAPHTRAAVVEAKCINYLIGFLYDHSDKASQDVALFAGSAILQLAEGAITRASVLGGGDAELQDGASPDKSDTLVE